MLRYQRLVAQIQNVLQTAEPCERARLAALARAYSAACEEANRRLRQVAECWRAGRQHQAREEIERAPHLLDLVAELEFDELPQWCHRLHELSLAAPPPLAVETAAELSDAFGETDPLQILLKNYRLMVLSSAPLGSRLLMLRRIGQLEPHNRDWQADLRGLEQARLQEIEQLAAAFYRSAHLEGLESLRDELADPHWLIAIPAELVDRIEHFHAQLTQRATAFGAKTK